MPSRRPKTKGYAVCLRNAGYGASLEEMMRGQVYSSRLPNYFRVKEGKRAKYETPVRKLYPVLSDPEAEANELIRVIDESGEDYLYPASLFQKLTLPADVQRPLRLAS